ncbi:DUF7882 family protein [Herbiconiux solani]|uniref:DUF7882 family protein n=1 Tax=Herbiconiux solani TaxID=661329 RepID=UPI000A72A4A0|nr:hypothetical protein [Herbiconiux solani]
MGLLIYGPSASEIELDDRLLAHLRIVILSKLRNHEAFSLSWNMDANQGSGRETLWVHPAIPLRFKFYGGRPPSINRAWIDAMVTAANRGDLRIMAEPAHTDADG